MADFLLKNNFFEFNGEVKRQKSGIAIGTKFAPRYACIFMDAGETKFLTSQHLHLRYIDNIFFIWTHGEESFVQFLDEFSNVHHNLSFTYETSKNNFDFLDLNVKLERWSNTY